ncbi:TPR-like protein [Serendipita vermifera]|nr:TPR-like protein [Serendipita vermifera]
MSLHNSEGLRLVSFDGGGPRGLSQLEIMRSIVHRVQKGGDSEDSEVLLPSKYFHMMGGSDTGGILVILLTRLNMSMDRASEALHKVIEGVWDGVARTPAERTARLKQEMEELLSSIGVPINAKLEEERREGRCLGFVVAKPKSDANGKAIFRTYKLRDELPSGITIVEAVLATCASSSFLPLSFGPALRQKEYVGACFGIPNPTREVILEAHKAFSSRIGVKALISLGNGHPGVLTADDGSSHISTMRTMKGIVVDCERVAREIKAQMSHLGVYHRFSLEEVVEDAFQESMSVSPLLVTATVNYLEDKDTLGRMTTCMKVLEGNKAFTTLEQLKYSGGGQAVYKGLPPVTRHFVMRNEPWSRLTGGILEQNPSEEQVVIVVTGLGGCGKTQLVTKFAHDYHDNYGRIFLVDGSSERSIRADLIAHVRSLGPDYSQAMLNDALDFFCRPQNKDWLLIIDNVDDLSVDVAKYLPQCTHGTIIITSRNHSLGKLSSIESLHISLDVMTREEAVDSIMISSRLTKTATAIKGAGMIAEELGFLPVALVQAGCYIFESQCTCQEYFGLLKKYRAEMMDAPSADRQRGSAYATFDISYNRLPENIRSFLHIISFFHFANFPMALLSHAASVNFRSENFKLRARRSDFNASIQLLSTMLCPSGSWDPHQTDIIVTVLQSYSLASFVPASGALLLQIHPLTHNWAYDRIPIERRQEFKFAAARLLACGDEGSDAGLERYLFPHVDSLLNGPQDTNIEIELNDLASFASICQRLGRAKHSKRMWQDVYDKVREEGEPESVEQAVVALQLSLCLDEDRKMQEDLVLQAIKIREKHFSADDDEMLDARTQLMGIYEYQCRYGEAQVIMEQIVESYRNKFGPDAHQTLKAIGELAWSHAWQGQYSKTEELERHVLDRRLSLLGEHHIDTLAAKHNLGYTLFALGRYDQAVELLSQAVEGQQKQLGLTHKTTLFSIRNLCLTYHAMGLFTKAANLQLEVVQEFSDVFGNIQDTLNAKEDLANTYIQQSHYSEAEELLRHILEARKKHLGDEHPDTLQAIKVLSLCYFRHSDYANAEKLRKHLVTVNTKQFGPDHRSTIDAMGDLAATYRNQHKYSEALTLEVKVLEGLKALLGDTRWETLNAMENLCETYNALYRFKDAESLVRHVVDERIRQMGEDQPHTYLGIQRLAIVYGHQGRYDEAEALHKKVLEGQKVKLGYNHEFTITSMQHLASISRIQGRYKDSEQLYREAVNRFQELIGDSGVVTILAKKNLASILCVLGRYGEAEPIQRGVYDALKQLRGENNEDTFYAEEELATIYLEQGRVDEAAKMLESIVEKWKAKSVSQGVFPVTPMKALAQSYELQGRFREASALLQNVVDIQLRRLGSDHPQYLHALLQLSIVHHSSGQYKDAESILMELVPKFETKLGASHPHTVESQEALGNVYRALGRYPEAEAKLQQASKAQVEIYGENHPRVLRNMFHQSLLYHDSGQLEEAKELTRRVKDLQQAILGESHPHYLSTLLLEQNIERRIYEETYGFSARARNFMHGVRWFLS